MGSVYSDGRASFVPLTVGPGPAAYGMQGALEGGPRKVGKGQGRTCVWCHHFLYRLGRHNLGICDYENQKVVGPGSAVYGMQGALEGGPRKVGGRTCKRCYHLIGSACLTRAEQQHL